MSLDNFRDWSGYVMTVISLLIAFKPSALRSHSRTVRRRWSVRIGNLIEVTREHRETDTRS